MIYSTRFRLIASFLAMCLLVGGFSLIVGVQLLNRSVLNEATTRIRQDLNSAREIYLNVERQMRLALSIAAEEQVFDDAVRKDDSAALTECISTIANLSSLDYAGVVSPEGKVLARAPHPVSGAGKAVTENPAVQKCLETGKTVSGTVILDRQMLLAEDAALAEQAKIALIPTPRAAPDPRTEETSGMTISCAVPVLYDGVMVGVIYGGVLLNRNNSIVDLVRETVFQQETYKGKNIGTATIFFNDLRVSTNVQTAMGERAIGTRVSQEVRDKVLGQGERWIDRAFVVNDWYITAYEPIVDVSGKRVGILYVGVLESKYVDIRTHTLLVFVIITCAGIIFAIILGYLLSQRILDPVHRLIEAGRRISAGDLSPEVGPISSSEIGVLQRTVQEMTTSLRERDRSQRAESELKLLQSEKQASVGRLAAGVAHEINNPLTGVLTFTHLLLRRKDLGDEVKQDLETIARSTERVRKIVKGLLDFSRQTSLQPEPTDINQLVRDTIPLVSNQALVKGVIFCFDQRQELPLRTVDRSQLQSVLLNIILNALDATERGGHITITTSLSRAKEAGYDGAGIEIAISDTGCGIKPEHLDKLFDPFFTTKEVGKGTGLGLSVSQGIVERHGGTISVRSTLGVGSTFIIRLPLDTEERRP